MTLLSLEFILVAVLVICDVKAQFTPFYEEVTSGGKESYSSVEIENQTEEDDQGEPSRRNFEDLLQKIHGNIPNTEEISNSANQILYMTQRLLEEGFSFEKVTSDSVAAGIKDALILRGICKSPTVYKCNALSPYRTIDGSCNNIQYPERGKSFVAQRRAIGPAYKTGTVGGPRVTGVTGKPLPNPRTISNVIHSNKYGVTINGTISLHTFQMGQFLDHDIIQTPLETVTGGCTCEENTRPECISIKIPEGDPFFTKRACLPVKRSAAANPDCTPGFRQQLNTLTSYIDGSNVYGSTEDELTELRDGGYMKTSSENNLPENPNDGCVIDHNGEFCHLAGEARVDAVPSLASYHTLFVMEHNRIVNALKSINPSWNVEKLFQEARKINIAQMQHIVYNGFLNAFLSLDTMITYNLLSLNTGYSFSYDPKRDATVSNEFGIAYRMGHTWIPTYQDLYSDLNIRLLGPEMGPFDLVKTFNNPHLTFLNRKKGCPALLKWLTSEASPATDRFVEDSVRNRLFEDSPGDGFDLVSLNINRGRDHGLPPYGDHRVSCGYSAVTSNWNSLVDHNTEEVELLRQVYDDPRDIDLFTGLLTERAITGSSLGPTLNCILGREFQNLKEGDSYWYERPEPQGFSIAQLNEIRKTSLSAVLCANLDLTRIQSDAFRLPGISNYLVRCTNVPSIDLRKWKSGTQRLKPGYGRETQQRNLQTGQMDMDAQSSQSDILQELIKLASGGEK
ncbi:hypothetical protein CHS0354_028874 [Potamilus streckersoni]|uniref:Peroxidase n=1 Tax=Potamilus streckersoni TaxID=2493646 RepID=A0AAE0RQN0_9BIVA|nr:hypothetical protein CHS0354_028874 [Potamilus streckersoni]